MLTATPLLVKGWQWLVDYFGPLPSDVAKASLWEAPWWAWVIAGLICFAAAQFLAWKEEYKKAADSNKELQDLKHPIFAGLILSVNVHDPPENEEYRAYSCGVFIAAEIVNTGADSIADRYTLTANINGSEVVGFPQIIPNRITSHGSLGTAVYLGTDALYNKTVSVPVVRGGKAIGNLWFMFKGVPREAVTGKNVRCLTLSFCDARRKQWKIAVADDISISHIPLAYPGIQGGIPVQPFKRL